MFHLMDTAFRCDCFNWLMYSSESDIGKVITCSCGKQWRVVSDATDQTAVEKVNADPA